MITLITGVPGSGKTLRVVGMLKSFLEENKYSRITAIGIPSLSLDVESVDYADYPQVLEQARSGRYAGGLIVIDEAQRLYPSKGTSNSLSPEEDFLHVHRHYGLDVILITQMPSRISKAARDLVGAHYHLKKTPLGVTMQYYWDYATLSPNNGRDAIISRYKLDKRLFGLYKSASEHLKTSTPKAKVLFVLPLAIVVLIVFSYLSYSMIMGIGKGGEGNVGDAVTAESSVSTGHLGGISEKIAAGAAVGSGAEKSLRASDFTETVEGIPESKPLYDSVRRVRSFETIAGCFSGGRTGCTCYSHQGTPLSSIPLAACKDYASNGLPFNPFRSDGSVSSGGGTSVKLDSVK